MKNLFILVFLSLIFSWAQAKDYSSAPEHGVLIGIASDKKAIKSLVSSWDGDHHLKLHPIF